VWKLGTAIQEAKGGVLQGSCLPPILFDIYTKKLDQVNEEKTQIMQFADHFTKVSSGKPFNSTVDNLQNKLTDFNLLCKVLGFSLNPRKSVVINVGRESKIVVNVAEENVAVPNQNKEERYSRVPRLSDTRYSAK